MDSNIQAVPGYYVWDLPGKPVVVHLNLAVIDRLAADVMRGFGLVPKRGAEVGGLLLGSIEQGARTIVRVEDFETVGCDYKRGPSYLFTADDGAAFEDACTRALPGSSQGAYAVGYFRSHTREGMSLGPEDIDLMDHYFPSPTHVALMIKPFATKVSIASFFFREAGLFQSVPPLEFPFRRRELTGEEAPPRRSMMERAPRRREPRPEIRTEETSAVRQIEYVEEEPVPKYAPPPQSKSRLGGVWIPLSFVFLLLGVVLGYQAALTMGPKAANTASDYALGLNITREATNLSVKWNGEAPAVRAAQRGILEIEGIAKPVDLDTAQLRNGSILLENASKSVRFRLIVYPQPDLSVTQTVDWKEP